MIFTIEGDALSAVAWITNYAANHDDVKVLSLWMDGRLKDGIEVGVNLIIDQREDRDWYEHAGAIESDWQRAVHGVTVEIIPLPRLMDGKSE